MAVCPQNQRWRDGGAQRPAEVIFDALDFYVKIAALTQLCHMFAGCPAVMYKMVEEQSTINS